MTLVNAARLRYPALMGKVNPQNIMTRIIMKKIAIVTFGFICLLMPLTTQAAFSDVPASMTGSTAISWMQEMGIVSKSAKYFFPEKKLTRADLHQFAWKAVGYDPIQANKDTSKKSSTKSNLTPYIQKSITAHILETKAESIKPREMITRGEALETTFNILGIGITRFFDEKNLPFKDIRPGSKWAPIAKTALEFGIMTDKKTFQAKKYITRKEYADMLWKLDQGLKDSQVQTVNINFEPTGSSSSGFVQNDKFKILEDVWNKIHEKFVFKDKINDTKLLYGAITGMVNKLGDKYTVFQEPKTAKTFNESLSGEFDGIGISIDIVNNRIRIVSPIKGTPAYAAGLKANDIIVEVNKKTTEGLILTEVSDLIRGPTGTSVEIVVERDGKKITFSIKRSRIKVDAVIGEIKEGTAVITITSFSQTSNLDFEKQIKTLLAKNPKAFIFDLRDNPGGFLDASLAMLDHILPKGNRLASLVFSNRPVAEEFYQENSMDGERMSLDPVKPEIYFASLGNGELATYPIKVLINGGSASASEIMAASLRENNKATLIGEKSFGKGTVQELTDYLDGSLLKETIGKWQTPNENNLTDNPMLPDIAITDDPKTDADEIMDYALTH